jgi:hypothetical protein
MVQGRHNLVKKVIIVTDSLGGHDMQKKTYFMKIHGYVRLSIFSNLLKI